jgi:phospholipid N-methyltransferase
MSDHFSTELKSFQDVWEGGYYEGDPLNPISMSSFHQVGFVSVLHATFLRCIKPYITKDTIALEIGPGKGAWTKALLVSKEVWALDARPEQDNHFFEYLGNAPNARYFQVMDFTCDMLPDNYFDYMFSFGCLCHVSFDGITEYAINLFPKLKEGCNCFWMVADYNKYNAVVENIAKYSIWKALVPVRRQFMPLRFLFDCLMRLEARSVQNQKPRKPDRNDNPHPGRWFHAGIERTCSMLKNSGYEIVDPDVGTVLRDPIIHFRKPDISRTD